MAEWSWWMICLLFLGGFVIGVGITVGLSLALIWALNEIFSLNIAYTFWHIVAGMVLIALVGGVSARRK